MKIYTSADKKPGDVLWGFAYKLDRHIRGVIPRMAPAYGILAARRSPADSPDEIKYGTTAQWKNPALTAVWFIPYKNNEPDWQNAIPADVCMYADSETNAIRAYNRSIRDAIRAQSARLYDALLLLPDEENAADAVPIMKPDTEITSQELLTMIRRDLRPYEYGTMTQMLSWVEFLADLSRGDPDPDSLDLILDGQLAEAVIVDKTTGMLVMAQGYWIPFQRVPEVFEGQDFRIAKTSRMPVIQFN